ncbi:MAG TPA: replicative DNA helicase [Bacillota bacterium]|nr:replicative DNA helicase [Peptococcaceae bacterium MAG4]NLW38797.1 replicative DNA helicase [Peptococcaceae bacterium]HPZ44327.1 replicative DNA helicase [Bacillota bacterium]HQD76960.1 replicative DNA helicase [Bacillota bacterium]HUM59719.1 replicative DNA helicase [Bacillota bacterium]
MLERVPPQNIDAEQSVLGAILIDKEAIYRVMKTLRPEDFYRESHRLIYEAMLYLNENGTPVDLITVSELLKQQGTLEKAGGVAYLASLAEMVPTSANVEFYTRIVEEKALLRTLIDLSTRIAAMGYDEGEEPEKLIAEAERMLMELGSRRVASAFFSIKDILLNTFSHLEYLYNNRGSITGVPTSFSDLDRLCSGLQPSDFIILAGRPSMGKTSLGLCIAYNAALKHNIPVAIFSLEMSKEQLVQRILCAEARVDQHRIRSGDLDEDDWRKLHETARVLAKAPIYIDDTPALSVRQVRAKARQLKAEKGLGLILIDYLQMMTGSRRSENRQQEISEISRSLKGLAKELNIPVLALAQLSRSVEQRPNKRPVMSDLRESGSLEQDADLIMFIYRDEYYNPDSEKKGIAEIIISKHRNGPVGTVELVFLKELTKFVPYLKDAGGV